MQPEAADRGRESCSICANSSPMDGAQSMKMLSCFCPICNICLDDITNILKNNLKKCPTCYDIIDMSFIPDCIPLNYTGSVINDHKETREFMNVIATLAKHNEKIEKDISIAEERTDKTLTLLHKVPKELKDYKKEVLLQLESLEIYTDRAKRMQNHLYNVIRYQYETEYGKQQYDVVIRGLENLHLPAYDCVVIPKYITARSFRDETITTTVKSHMYTPQEHYEIQFGLNINYEGSSIDTTYDNGIIITKLNKDELYILILYKDNYISIKFTSPIGSYFPITCGNGFILISQDTKSHCIYDINGVTSYKSIVLLNNVKILNQYVDVDNIIIVYLDIDSIYKILCWSFLTKSMIWTKNIAKHNRLNYVYTIFYSNYIRYSIPSENHNYIDIKTGEDYTGEIETVNVEPNRNIYSSLGNKLSVIHTENINIFHNNILYYSYYIYNNDTTSINIMMDGTVCISANRKYITSRDISDLFINSGCFEYTRVSQNVIRIDKIIE
jgi:hypothetical protein